MQLDSLYFCLTFIFSGIGIGQGIRCLTCENAISNKDCIRRGRLVDCTGEGIGCSSEVRYHAGFVNKIQVRKGCKQILACGSDKSQNGHGWYPVQCNPKYPDSICRCCCQTDNCNRDLIGCEPPQPECRKLKPPTHGAMQCDADQGATALRTICIFKCDKGYQLKGYYSTQCVLNKSGGAYWTTAEPKCATKKCKPKYKNTPSRKVSCTNKNYAFSVCTFSCTNGHIMTGEKHSTCLVSKNWDYPPPKCVKITCPPPKNPPAYSEMHCSDGMNFGSICKYTCDPGYILSGRSKMRCVQRKYTKSEFGMWSGKLPQCIAIMCGVELTNPQFGQVECTSMNFLGSTCSYICKDGYKLVGESTTTCLYDEESGKSEWTSDAPSCQPIKCSTIDTEGSNSRVSCSNTNNVGSVCAFACNRGAYLKSMSKRVRALNQLMVTCLSDGSWSEELATCSKIRCLPEIREIPNGKYDCTDGNNYMSYCLFSCDEGYEIVGQKRSVCRDSKSRDLSGVWSNPQPHCVRIGCKSQQRSDSKMIVSCSNKYLFGSTCTFNCRNGYYMTSSDSVFIEQNEYSLECLDSSEWSGLPPVCKNIICLPEIGALTNGQVICSKNNLYKSRCVFSCDVGYGLIGPAKIFCSGDNHVAGVGPWKGRKPTCKRNGCAPLFEAPIHGNMNCSNRNRFKSVCEFTCSEGFYMASQDNYLVEQRYLEIQCSKEGDWEQSPPTCRAIVCEPLNQLINFGTIQCTNGDNFRSRCTYVCDEGYEVDKFTNTTECTGKLTREAYGTWTVKNIKCIRSTCSLRQRAPNGGKVACTSGNGVGSECKFSCYDGHYMSSSDKNIILSNSLRVKCEKNKAWTSQSPKCIPVTCPKKEFPNGEVSCSRSNIYRSECSFSCMPGYGLVGGNYTACRSDFDNDDKGMWSAKWPECKELVCDGKEVNNPDNGLILCSDGFKLHSTCQLVCERGYERIGGEFTVCRRESLTEFRWNRPIPKCTPIK